MHSNTTVDPTAEANMSDLGEYFRLQAGWREGMAAQFPDDPGNPQSAQALLSLVTVVEQEPDRDLGDFRPAAVAVLESQVIQQGSELSLGGTRTKEAVGRYGYDSPSLAFGAHALFLGELLGLVEHDAYDRVAELGEDPTGLLSEREVAAALEGLEIRPEYFRLRDKEQREKLLDELSAHQDGGE